LSHELLKRLDQRATELDGPDAVLLQDAAACIREIGRRVAVANEQSAADVIRTDLMVLERGSRLRSQRSRAGVADADPATLAEEPPA
jgi:hypothetical protein